MHPYWWYFPFGRWHCLLFMSHSQESMARVLLKDVVASFRDSTHIDPLALFFLELVSAKISSSLLYIVLELEPESSCYVS